MSDVPLDEVIYFDCVTHHPSTGAVTDADSTPSFEVFEEATDTDIGVGGNLTKRTSKTGNYRGTFTLSAANGFEVGKWYNIIASATVNSIVGKAVIRTFRVVAAEVTAGKSPVTIAAGDLAADSITATVIADNAIDAASIASGAITSAKFASGAITAGVIADGAIDNATFATDTWLRSLRSGQSDGGNTASTFVLDASAPATDDLYRDCWIVTTEGTGAGQSRLSTAYDGTSKACDITPDWADTPDSSTKYAIVPAGRTSIGAIASNAGGVPGLERATRAITVGTVGSGSTTTSIVCSSLTPNAGAADSHKGLILKFDKDTTTAALRGQGTDITSNTSGATPTLTVTALTTAPVSGDTFTAE